MAVTDLITDPDLRPLLALSQSTLKHILDMLSWVDQNQSIEPSLTTQLTLSKYQKTMIAHLAQIRGHNRRAIFGVRATKQETAEARQEVDRLLLQLQNLYYEQRHLMGEIGACEGYEYVSIPSHIPPAKKIWVDNVCSHAYTHLPLLSLESYLEAFPEQGNLAEQDLMPLRIEQEKQEREKMEQERQELLKTKESLVKINVKKKEELRKIDEQLEKMIDGLKPISDALTKEI
jgi:THO complex subunit 5